MADFDPFKQQVVQFSQLLALCTERKISKIPLLIREIAFAKRRKDQKAMG